MKYTSEREKSTSMTIIRKGKWDTFFNKRG
jgi:hypothetical protein